MADRTGRAPGTLDPVIYFHNPRLKVFKVDHIITVHLPHGHFLMPPVEVGQGPALARMIWERKFKDRGYEWREANTLSQVDDLQEQLVEQHTRIMTAQGEHMDTAREASRMITRSNLRQRMMSAACTPFERDFISTWLQLDPEKRKKYIGRFTEANMYLWAAAMDSKNTDVTERMGD